MFILDRGTIVFAEVSTDHYRRSPLVQSGIEIPCKITVRTPVLKKYKDLVTELYTEPKNEQILGSFLVHDDHNETMKGM